jgi:hypothetical protein
VPLIDVSKPNKQIYQKCSGTVYLPLRFKRLNCYHQQWLLPVYVSVQCHGTALWISSPSAVTYFLMSVRHPRFDIHAFPGRLWTAKWTVNYLRLCRKKTSYIARLNASRYSSTVSLSEHTNVCRSFNGYICGNDALYNVSLLLLFSIRFVFVWGGKKSITVLSCTVVSREGVSSLTFRNGGPCI